MLFKEAMPHNQNLSPIGFEEMNLDPDVFSVLPSVGFHTPTPIQAMTIPHIMQQKDLIGQARTGTGKTAAFALPLLSRIKLDDTHPQVLVITPTRELAIQVAQAFKDLGQNLKGLKVLPVYGGQSYGVQLNQLKKGVHIVVGTPGRLMDHMRRKTVSFANLVGLVLDEADEMLEMGFIEDVEWIVSKIPATVQTALFSATMPPPVQKISGRYLKDPVKVLISHDADITSTIEQTFWIVKGLKKNDALVRMLKGACHDAVIVFTKTRQTTMELARVLEEKGFRAQALNGDMAQAAREQAISRLKHHHIDILVATDVAARGLDVDRISHVINYDMPSKIEPYIHRIGRTGRAGRTGKAILFVHPAERFMLKKIETATRQKVTPIFPPSDEQIRQKRLDRFKDSVLETIQSQDISEWEALVKRVSAQQDLPVTTVAGALAKMLMGETPLDKQGAAITPPEKNTPLENKKRKKTGAPALTSKQKPALMDGNTLAPAKKGLERYRIEVGQRHGLRPKDIVGAICNETGLESRFIGAINIDNDYALVDLPFGMPKNIFQLLQKTYICSKKMAISRYPDQIS